MHPLVELLDVGKTYQKSACPVQALRHVSLRLFPGEMVAVVGRSGSGKSTLLHIMGCLDTPSAGRYLLDGQDVSRLSDNTLAAVRRRAIGFIFQKFYLLPELTALENVELPLSFRGIPHAKRRQLALSSLQKVGLLDRAAHRPGELSGGQQQRVAIARALAGSPPLILADEPTGNLDRASGNAVMDLLHRLHAAGHTVVLITHDDAIAEQAPRRIRIEDGRLFER